MAAKKRDRLRPDRQQALLDDALDKTFPASDPPALTASGGGITATETAAATIPVKTRAQGKQSAGLLMYRRHDGAVQILLVHPGGPFWARKDLHAWSIPKGEYGPGDDPQDAALREFEEELGRRPAGEPAPLGDVVQRGGKRVAAFAMEGDFDVAGFRSNTCEIEWPPRSGKTITIPEVDRAEWLSMGEARNKILEGQLPLLDRLAALLEMDA